MKNSIVFNKQQPLIISYLQNPEKAWITDYAKVEGKNFDDPFHTSLSLNNETQNTLSVGLHRAVGGLHDVANPGDILCGALASCFESTLRMIANRLNIKLTKTIVEARAYADVRGTLRVDKNIPVEFQKMSMNVYLSTKMNNVKQTSLLIDATKHSCVVYQTLQKSTPIEVISKILN